MFKNIRRYIANKIYNDDSLNYNNRISQYINDLRNDDKLLILNQKSEIKQLKNELLLANKALLKSTDDT